MFFASPTLTRIRNPEFEPITLAEAKDFLRIPDSVTKHDPFIGIAIKAARIKCESMVGRTFIESGWRMSGPISRGFVYRFPGNPFFLPNPPILSIDSISYAYDSVSPSVVVPVDSYVTIPGHAGGFGFLLPFAFPYGVIHPVVVSIDYTAGYGPDPSDVPETVGFAMRFLVTHYFEHRSTNAEVPDVVQSLMDTVGNQSYA